MSPGGLRHPPTIDLLHESTELAPRQFGGLNHGMPEQINSKESKMTTQSLYGDLAIDMLSGQAERSLALSGLVVTDALPIALIAPRPMRFAQQIRAGSNKPRHPASTRQKAAQKPYEFGNKTLAKKHIQTCPGIMISLAFQRIRFSSILQRISVQLGR